MLIKPDGSKCYYEHKLTLSEMQALVEGYIECIFFNDDCVAVVNEEGKIKGMQHNPTASIFVGQDLYGPVLIFSKELIL